MNKFTFKIETPINVLKIHKIFKTLNFDLFLVGGCVRDSILGVTPKDWDLLTNAEPNTVIKLLKNQDFVTNILETGKIFGVINVITNDGEFEIATMRKDIGSGRRPDSVEFTDIETDILRRDLTCNALYYDIDTKEVIDLVGGINDIKKGIIRTVGKPEDRFKEDKLRILRSIRFAGRFGSQLDPNIDKVLSNDSSLKGISPERIRDEFLKTIKSAKSIQQVFLLIDKYKLWGEIFPGININKRFVESKDPIIVISTLMLGNEPSNLSKVLNKLTYSISENKAITFLISFSTFNDINNVYKMKKIFNASNVTNEQLREFNNINKILPSNVVDTFINFQLSVTGDQVQSELGIKPGPEMGKTIEKMEIDNFKKLL